MIQQDIFGFEVPVDDPDLVDVLDPRDYLLVVLARLLLLQAFRLADLLEQLVPAAILHYQKQVLIIFNNL